ncbi:MAG: SRPBCC family protein [Actinomycetota bacterium]|nr:SRPBCC family protein [Actinomycetota bacterium]
MPELRESVDVAVAPQQVWDTLVHWERQGEWMLLTKVRATVRDGQGVGGGIEGWTGVGPVGVLDEMEIRVWEPPHRVVTRHLGRVVRGGGAFEITDLGDGRSRFTWSEWLDLPLGVLGRLGWPLARPFVRAGFVISLRRFKRYVEAGAPAR